MTFDLWHSVPAHGQHLFVDCIYRSTTLSAVQLTADQLNGAFYHRHKASAHFVPCLHSACLARRYTAALDDGVSIMERNVVTGSESTSTDSRGSWHIT